MTDHTPHSCSWCDLPATHKMTENASRAAEMASLTKDPTTYRPWIDYACDAHAKLWGTGYSVRFAISCVTVR